MTERHVIVQEGPDGAGPERFVIEHGALHWEEGRHYPLTISFDHSVPPVGYAADLRREADGKITAAVHLAEGRSLDEAYSLAESSPGRAECRIAFTGNPDALTTLADGSRLVTEARLLEVAVIMVVPDERTAP